MATKTENNTLRRMLTKCLDARFSKIEIANVLFPVCLSPMINSRCPVPIGNKQSISRKPVATFPSLRDLDKIFGALASARTQRMTDIQEDKNGSNARNDKETKQDSATA